VIVLHSLSQYKHKYVLVKQISNSVPASTMYVALCHSRCPWLNYSNAV